MLSWVFLGGVVGMLLGLTGAGGSIIALPLLQFLMEMSVHEASVAVLPIVGVAALLSVFPQRRHVHMRLAAVVLGVSMPVTYAMAWATLCARTCHCRAYFAVYWVGVYIRHGVVLMLGLWHCHCL